MTSAISSSHPLCVFLDSREQGKLSANHPFYRVIEEAIQDVLHAPLVLKYLARSTFRNRPRFYKVTEEQRVHHIIEYLQNNSPTFSGSDSPALDSTFVDVRAYYGCGKDSKSKKVTRQHVYIQKRFVDAWMKSYSLNERRPYFGRGPRPVLTLVMKLFLLRGLATAVKVEFTSGAVTLKNNAHPRRSAYQSPCSFEYFLSQWSNAWLVFKGTDLNINNPYEKVPYEKLSLVVFTDHFHHVKVGSSWRIWRPFPQPRDNPYMIFQSRCLQLWDSHPMEDPRPQRIEVRPLPSDKRYFERMWAQFVWGYTAWQRVDE
ncbi:hypothetical protein AZE42_07385 [Rhizopogon vesiculosus]|uniref:Uncharacterized protein n=1 Tax=Rhizopogon vesiculosus TaxID=180088 RepID=A0A1J8PTH2_9AGAM|nr:hypothetical protein AZE42_07385 [Rhizopogon vesiculosus]